MALDRAERKKLLKWGEVTKIAKRCRRSKGHVSEVISGTRRDAVVEKEFSRRKKLSPLHAFGPPPAKPKKAA